MSFITDHKQKFDDLHTYIKNMESIRLKANGGNTILVSIPPEDEFLYINKSKELFSETAAFIDISKLFVKFIEKDGWEIFKEFYQDFRDTPHKVFMSDDPAEDLFDMIIAGIQSAGEKGKIPFLIRTGCLDGTGIENINIAEHSVVMKMKLPLIIFYPSIVKNGTMHYLNYKPASKYRSVIVK
jgi:hypothetical protein